MSVYLNQAGQAGNVTLGTPSGGGAFAVPPGPINPANYGNNGKISLFDPSMVDASPTVEKSPVGSGSGWDEVLKQLALLGGAAVISRLTDRKSPGNRDVGAGSKGELGSAVQAVPSATPPGSLFALEEGTPTSPGGLKVNSKLLIPLAIAAGVLAIALFMRR